MYESPHGKAAGLSQRLMKFANGLARDNRYPWLGTGLIDDLRAAAAIIEGQPVPPTLQEEFEAEFAPELKPDLEYDL